MFESSGSAPRLGAGVAQTLRRIMKECEEIKASKNPFWTAAPVNEDDPFEWHFTVRGPPDTEFEGGLYHGRLVLPPNYPLSAPSIFLLNQSGRFEVGKKVCMSASPYHPELWQPAWGIRTMFDALHVFFATPAEGAVNSLDWPPDVRRKLAAESVLWRCPICKKSNQEIVDECCSNPTTDGPALPMIMVPSTVSSRCPYLRAKQEPSAPESSSSSKSVTSPSPTSQADVPQSLPPHDTDDDLQARRERRRQAASSGSSVPHLLPVLLRTVLKPIPGLIHAYTNATPLQAALRFLDLAIVLLSIVTFVLIFDLIWHPGPLINAFLLDRID